MLTKLLAAILLASCFTLSVSPTEATTSVLLTSGLASTHAGVAFVDLHGPGFDLVGMLFPMEDFAPFDLCSPCDLGSFLFNGWHTLEGPIPPAYPFGTTFSGTLTWQGVSYQLARVIVSGDVFGFGMRLPSQSGAWHVDVPSTMSFYIADFGLSASGTGIWSLNIGCDAGTGFCSAVGSLNVLVKRQVLACDGFASPANVAISLRRKSNRVIPLHMTLQDWWSHAPTTDANIPSGVPPVVDIRFSPGPGVPAGDETDQFVPVAASPDDTFTYDSTTDEWKLNLSTKPYTAAGTYIVRVRPGSSDYAIVRNDFDPTCEMRFVRE